MGQNLALYSKSLPSLEIDYQKVLTLQRVENRKIEGKNASLIWNADMLLSHCFWARGGKEEQACSELLAGTLFHSVHWLV